MSFVSFVLGWKKPRRMCIDCMGKVKIQIEAKIKEKPELKAEGEKEILYMNDWLMLSPSLRVRR